MQYLVQAFFGKSHSIAQERDIFMQRLDRIARERTRPIVRRAAA